MNVLMTSASRKVLLVRAFQRALSATCGGAVLAGDTSRTAAALYEADRGLIMPRSDSVGFAEWLLDACLANDVKLVVPTRDEELPVLAAVREEFAQAGIVVAVSPPDAVKRCQDKSAFVAFCAAHGFKTPRSVSPDAVTSEDFPLFVKPRRGKGGRGALRVDDRHALGVALLGMEEYILQDYCVKPELTLDVFSDLNGTVLSVVPRARTVVVGGESFVSTTVNSAALIARGCDLVEMLGLRCHVTVQCFWDSVEGEGEPLFIEVNPRYGGAANLGFAAGHPTPEYLIRLVLGETLEPCLGAFEDGLTMLRHTEDLFLGRQDIGRGLQ